MTDLVLREMDGGVAVLTLNRPEKLNAWTPQMEQEYFAALEDCAGDDAVRAIVVTGAGRGFCAGADMGGLQELGANGGARDTSGRRPQTFPTTIAKPVLAAINGACAGIGLVQALMCDLRFAASGVKFTTAFARRGLVAEYGISWALPRLVGTANALDLLMSGRVFLAEEAKAIGMVNDVVPADQLMDHVLHYAADVAANSCPTSMAVMKRQVYADSDRSLQESSDGAIPLMQASLKRPDFVEGVQSYLAKRPPNFGPVLKDA